MNRTLTRSRAVIAAVLAAAFSAIMLATASPAQAGWSTVAGCNPEEVCVYKGSFAAGNIVARSKGTLPDITLSADTWYYVFNNGVADAGADHYYFKWSGSGNEYCLHYNTDSTASSGEWYGFRSYKSEKLYADYWGGEC
ncbi:hypothetical protein ACFQS3_08325 [Glycomyces mayteni]|uniref:Peptidase inhibitor family I36 n=1 Tax=Glycomyces mayteni TaxID=543887 RepID=A0ABW2D8D0_9ACTN|nr:hypothetical protein GCM10025732_25950 [Glycomyces mayteni]